MTNMYLLSNRRFFNIPDQDYILVTELVEHLPLYAVNEQEIYFII